MKFIKIEWKWNENGNCVLRFVFSVKWTYNVCQILNGTAKIHSQLHFPCLKCYDPDLWEQHLLLPASPSIHKPVLQLSPASTYGFYGGGERKKPFLSKKHGSILTNLGIIFFWTDNHYSYLHVWWRSNRVYNNKHLIPSVMFVEGWWFRCFAATGSRKLSFGRTNHLDIDDLHFILQYSWDKCKTICPWAYVGLKLGHIKGQ